MLPKFAWVLAPLVLYGAVLAVQIVRGRAPSRLGLNVHISLLLLAYLLGTAGLGIFWVANQQLPVFDWHYLFGYTTLLLVSLHLVFNLPVVTRWFGRRRASTVTPAASTRKTLPMAQVLLLVLALAVAYYVGTRQGGGTIHIAQGAAMQSTVAQYHAYSSESRASVFQRAPGVAWGNAPPAFKTYSKVPHIQLEKGAPGTVTLGQMLAQSAPGQALTLASLGRVLYLSSGVTLRRGGFALRAAPSSGALFPSELYVAARSVVGLAPGLYHYDPERHRLDRLGPLPASIGAPQAAQADAVVLLSAVFRRTGYKYHNRAYRYALADAGHLLENLRVAAHAAGQQARLLRQFDEAAAAAALRIDGIEEGVLAMLRLDRADSARATNILPPDLAAGQTPAFIPVEPAAAGSLGVTGVVHQATSLRAASSAPDAPIALPPGQAAAAELFTTIVGRRSQRRFSDAPLALARLSDVLAGLRQQPQLHADIEVSLVVTRVAGLAQGIYRYGPGHALRLVRAGNFGAAAQSAALSQDVIGDAAVVLILSSERERVLAGGARQYRHALIETGLIGERWLLGAAASRLAACPVGAFYDDEAAALIGVDAARHWVFHFAALGVPAAGPDGP